MLFIHPPGEPLVFCKGLVSVSIRVHPWLNSGFQAERFPRLNSPAFATGAHLIYSDYD